MKRPRHPMPDDVAEVLVAEDLRGAYDERPPYQRNDYIAWISRAKRDETRQRRIRQMLDELAAGDIYMKMPWNGPRA